MWWLLQCYCTVEPLGVVLCRPERWHAAQAAVYDGVTAGEVDDGGGVQLSALCHHRRGVVTRVVRAARHAVHPLQHAAHVSHLVRRGERGTVEGEVYRAFSEFLLNSTHKRTLIRTSRVVHSGWKALVPQVMTSVLFTSRTLM